MSTRNSSIHAYRCDIHVAILMYGLSNLTSVHFILQGNAIHFDTNILHYSPLLPPPLPPPPPPPHTHINTQTLNKVTSDIIDAETTNATSEVNTPKNRYQDKIPCKAAINLLSGSYLFIIQWFVVLQNLFFMFVCTGICLKGFLFSLKPNLQLFLSVYIFFSTDNHSRVYLKPAAIQGSDYINASFINVRLSYSHWLASSGLHLPTPLARH